MKVSVGVLRDDLLLVVADNVGTQYIEAMSKGLNVRLEPLGVQAIVFGTGSGQSEIVDLREAPPEVNDAAKVVAEWVKSHE